MRVSVPTIPRRAFPAQTSSPAAAVERVAAFLASGTVTLVTGAGVSVDSGIRAYRGKDGRYMNPNYRPIFYQDIVADTPQGHAFRQRYWLRSYLGYPPVRDAQPNTTHYALAALQHAGPITHLVTQNVDGLHRKAVAHLWDAPRTDAHVLELHGTLHRVRCLFGHVVDRETFQASLSAANPGWKAWVDALDVAGKKPRTNPDGDVELDGVSYDDFVVPACAACLAQGRRNTNRKPDLVFFGESIPHGVKERSFSNVERSDKLFLVGTTLATYSAYRLVKHALELKKPVLLLNMGPTRVDGLPGVDKVEIETSHVMRDVVRAVLGSRATTEPVASLLNSGIHKPPLDDSDGQQNEGTCNEASASDDNGNRVP